MRIIDYYNLLAAGACLILAGTALVLRAGGRRGGTDTKSRQEPGGGLTFVLLALILAGGTLLRTVRLTALPGGLQQDEASIGYEAYCLATYGIDRNGYHWPVYPITWGSGGGSPLMIYLNVLTTKLFGSRVFSIRIVPAVLGSATILLFFFLVRKIWGSRLGLAGAFVLSLMPWHIMLSRWSLDSNTMPFFETLACLVMVCAAAEKNGRRRTLLYCASAALSALCLYVYGSATLVIPVYLLVLCLILMKSGDLTPGQFALGIGSALVILLPLAYFYGVNYLGLPEIALDWISFPRFTSDHTGTVFISFGEGFGRRFGRNLLGLWKILTTGLEEEVIWNQMPGYATLYRFTFPITFLGIGEGAVRFVKHGAGERDDRPVFVLLLAALVFTLFIQQDYNRSVMLYLPLIYFYLMGLRFLREESRVLAAAGLLILAVGFLSFARDYYGGTYNELCRVDFMSGYGEAVEAAWEERGRRIEEGAPEAEIRSTYTDVGSPFMIALYYTKYNPYDFMDTVTYKDAGAEFRVARSFGCFTFGLEEPFLPEDGPEDIYIVTESEGSLFGEGWTKEAFGHYLLVYR